MEDGTSFSALGLSLIILFGALTVVLPRRYAILPVLASTVLLTIGQQVSIGGFNFHTLRLILLFGWVRILVRGETRNLSLTRIDKTVLLWMLVASLISPEGFATRAGAAYNSLGAYFLARVFLTDLEDVILALKGLTILGVVLAVFMSVELSTGRNYFSGFGGVPAATPVRLGKLRCQGAFTHAIHAGNFGATLTPLAAALWFAGAKRIGFLGVLSAAVIVFSSHSSGPLIAWVYGILGLAFWFARHRMRLVRRGILVALLLLNILMNAPIWFVLAKLSDFVGGGGYWRAKLIDQAIKHWQEWWLSGTAYTVHWSPTGVGIPAKPDMMDITNQFIAEAVGGGVLRALLFIATIVYCYKVVGRVVHDRRQSPKVKALYWGCGASLFAYILSFFSVALSTQASLLYFSLVAFFSARLPSPSPALDTLEGVPVTVRAATA